MQEPSSSPAQEFDPRPEPVQSDSDAGERVSLAREFVWFLRENKKWWLIPLILMFCVLMALLAAIVKAGALAPLLYPFL
jgi:hypothetical protein